MNDNEVFVLMHFNHYETETPGIVHVCGDVRSAMTWLCEKATHYLRECPQGYSARDARKLVELAKADDYSGFTDHWNGICEADKLLCYRLASTPVEGQTFDNALGSLAEAAVRCLDD